MIAGGKRYITHGSKADVFTLWGLGDLHVGAAACAENDLRRDIARIKDDPFALWVGLGDYADFIGYTDAKRFDPDAVADWLTVRDLGKLGTKSIERVRDLLKPIAGKCIGLLLGNHEKKYQQVHQQENLHGWLCNEMQVPSLGYCAFVDLIFDRTAGVKVPKMNDKPTGERSSVFRVFAHHGAGYAQTPGGKLNRLIQFMRMFSADIYFCGHVHDRTARRMSILGADADCGKIKAVERIGMISGSYLKTYEESVITYGEQKAYEPVPLGAACVSIKPETRELRAEI
jgi:hypothetical protein